MTFIPLMKAAFTEEKKTCEKLAKFIKSVPKLSMGKQCFEFETQFAKFQGRKHAILVNSGGSANLLLLQVLKNMGKIKKGDNVGFSSLTWSTNVFPIIQIGCNPIPLDCDVNFLNVTSEILEEAIKRFNLKCFFATNVLGFTGDSLKIKEICKKYNVLYIEDSCESLGTELNGIKTGNFGIASTFSFFVAHHLSTIEGGMICTDDDEIAMNIVMSRANGWDRNLTKEQQNMLRKKYNIKSEFESKYIFYDIGFNMRPTEITGLLGIEQLKYLKNNLKIREKNFKEIIDVMRSNDDFITTDYSHLNFIPAFSIPVICKTKQLREKYIKKFQDKVEIRPLICGNIIDQPAWKKYIKKYYNLPYVEFMHSCSFYFTNDQELKKEDLKIIKELLKK